tara:strand:- start:108 stop:311 length:204 start_codon:yes stop_codon:yes gene_type:complete
MSSEQAYQNISSVKNSKLVNEKVFHKVDINHLLAEVRDKQKKSKRDNLVFLGLISSVIVATGVIVSF